MGIQESMSIEIAMPQLVYSVLSAIQLGFMIHGDLKNEKGRDRIVGIVSSVLSMAFVNSILWWGGWYDGVHISLP